MLERIRLRIEAKELSELLPAEYNPRRISGAAYTGLKRSILRFGLVQPIIWNERTGNVVGGHQRLQALIDAGESSTQVVVVDLDPAEEKALNLALNNPGIEGEFTDAVADIIAELQLELPDLTKELRLDQIASTIGEIKLPSINTDDIPLGDEPDTGDELIRESGEDLYAQRYKATREGIEAIQDHLMQVLGRRPVTDKDRGDALLLICQGKQ